MKTIVMKWCQNLWWIFREVAYLIYLQKIFDEHVEPEIDLFKKYAYGVVFGRFEII